MIVPTPDTPALLVREAELADIPFIRDSWKHSFHEGGHAPRCEPILFWEGQSDVITRLLGRSRVLVASNPEDRAQIFGWVCFEQVGPLGVVHYVVVKRPFRRMGVAKSLLEHAVGGLERRMHSHRTKLGERVAARVGSTWNPYLLGGIG